MSLRECDARAGFQITLQRDRTALVGKLNHKVHLPRAVLRSMDAAPAVVDREASYDVGCDSRVVLRRAFVVLEDVDEPLALGLDQLPGLRGEQLRVDQDQRVHRVHDVLIGEPR